MTAITKDRAAEAIREMCRNYLELSNDEYADAIVDALTAPPPRTTHADPLVRRLVILRDTVRQGDGKRAWVPLSELDAVIAALTAPPEKTKVPPYNDADPFDALVMSILESPCLDVANDKDVCACVERIRQMTKPKVDVRKAMAQAGQVGITITKARMLAFLHSIGVEVVE